MGMHKWAAPRLFLSLSGDKTAAKKLERKARIYTGYLFDQLRPGQTYRTQTWHDRVGSVIKSTVWRDVLGERAVVKIFAPETGGEGTAIIALLEHGLLVTHSSIIDYLPLSIFIGDDLRAYYGDDEVFSRRIIDDDYYLSAVYSQSTYDNSAATKKLIDQLGAEAYLDLPPTTQPTVTSSALYTGLLRFGVQSWLMVGRAPSGAFYAPDSENQACPFDIANPYTDGLIENAGIFWWVRVNQTSVSFRQMINNTQLIPADEDEEKRRVAWLSGLAPKSPLVEFIVPLPTLPSVLSGGRGPIVLGWKFTHSSPWKASVVTQRPGDGAPTLAWYRESTLATITFSFSVGGTPLCELAILEQDIKFVNRPIQPLWVDTEAVLKPPGLGYTWADDIDTNAPLYCFYDKADELLVLRHRDLFESTTVPIGTVPWLPCGSGDARTYFGQTLQTVESRGYSIGSHDNSAIVESTSATIRVEEQAHVNLSTYTASSGQVTNCDGDPLYTQLDDVIPTGADYYFPNDSVTNYRDVYRRDALTYKEDYIRYNQFVLIPSSDAEFIYIARGDFHDTYDRSSRLTEAVEGNNGDVVESYYSVVMWRILSQSPFWEELPADITIKRSNIALFSGGYDTTRTYYDDIKLDNSEVWAVTSRGDFACEPMGEWSGCQFYSVVEAGGCQGAAASMAYNNGGFFTTGKAGIKQLLDNYNLVAPSSRDSRWIGDA